MNNATNKCHCACHTNKLKKPYGHDTECCDGMNGDIEITSRELDKILKAVANSFKDTGGKSVHRMGVSTAKQAIEACVAQKVRTARVEAIASYKKVNDMLENKIRKDELESFNPLLNDHSKCLDPKSCMGYQNAESDFDNEKQMRLAELTNKTGGEER